MGGVPPTKHPKWMEIIVAVRRSGEERQPAARISIRIHEEATYRTVTRAVPSQSPTR